MPADKVHEERKRLCSLIDGNPLAMVCPVCDAQPGGPYEGLAPLAWAQGEAEGGGGGARNSALVSTRW